MLRRLLLLAVGGSLVALACSSSTGSSASESKGSGNSDGDAGASAISIRLGDGVGLDFATGTPQQVTVQVDPPGVYSVRFSLAGDAADAFLDKSQADTDSNGRTSVL